MTPLDVDRACAWCRGPIPPHARRDAATCSKRCRQAAFRLRRRRATVARVDRPLRFAYADPPYPGLARKYYGDQPTFAGEVDHAQLVEELEAANYDGWALSTSARALVDILPLCPRGARVCAWVKPIGACPTTNGLHNCWEPLIVVRGRQLPPGQRDWLRAMPARGGGDLPGRKPLAFCAWLFDCLGMLPGDELADLFPGTGIVGQAWANLSPPGVRDARRAALSDASPAAALDGSPPAGDDGSSLPRGDASHDVVADASARARGDTSPAPACATRRGGPARRVAEGLERPRRWRASELLPSPLQGADASLLQETDA